jgi:hypothetical protein
VAFLWKQSGTVINCHSVPQIKVFQPGFGSVKVVGSSQRRIGEVEQVSQLALKMLLGKLQIERQTGGAFKPFQFCHFCFRFAVDDPAFFGSVTPSS